MNFLGTRVIIGRVGQKQKYLILNECDKGNLENEYYQEFRTNAMRDENYYAV